MTNTQRLTIEHAAAAARMRDFLLWARQSSAGNT
jgi:hypothetical protein